MDWVADMSALPAIDFDVLNEPSGTIAAGRRDLGMEADALPVMAAALDERLSLGVERLAAMRHLDMPITVMFGLENQWSIGILHMHDCLRAGRA